nr:MAG TPA: hypothetical protein [Bacteriophage sp.]
MFLIFDILLHCLFLFLFLYLYLYFLVNSYHHLIA